MPELAEPAGGALVLTAAEALAGTPFFAGLSVVDLARLVPELDQRQMTAGQAVFREGEPADGLYLIRSGAVRVSVEVDGVRQVVAVLHEPAYFGEMALLTDEPRSASVDALTPLSVWRLPRERFDALVKRHPRLPLQLAAEVTRRLAATTRDLSESRHELVDVARAAYAALDPTSSALVRLAAVVPEADAGLLRQLADQSWSDAAFERLVRDGAFFEPTSTAGWLRFPHDSIRRFLLAELAAELGPDCLRALQRRATDALLERGEAHLDAALDLLDEAGDWDRLAQQLDRHGHDLVRRSPAWTEARLRALPESSLWARPALVSLLAEACQRQGQIGQAVETYVEAARRSPATREGPAAAEFQRALADLYERMGRRQEAMACLRRAVELAGRLDGFGGVGAADGHGASDRAGTETHRGRLELAGARGLAAASLTGRALSRRPRQLAAAAIAIATGWIWLLPPPGNLSAEGLRVLSMVMASIAMAFLRVIPEYLVALLMVAAWVMSGTLPPKVAAAGFANPTWFLLLASMAVGTAVAQSGLMYRGAVEIVRRTPPSHALRCLTLATLGLVFSSGMPNPVGRVSLAAPLAQDVADSLRCPSRSGGSAGLALATFLGFGMMGSLFLTGSANCLIIYGLLPPDVQARMSWVNWFLAALPAHLIIFGATMAVLLLRYRPEQPQDLSPGTTALQREVLGPLSRKEWSALLVLGTLLVGFTTQSLHGIDPAWLGILGVTVLFLTGALDDATFKGGVNLSLLLYLGVIMGFGEIFGYLRLDVSLSENLDGVAALTNGSQGVFVMLVAALAAAFGVMRLGALVIVLGLALFPTAAGIGVSPWIVAFASLLASNTWLYPQQNLMYLTTYFGTGERAFSHAQARPLAFVHAASILVAILLSIPYWRWLGLIT